MIFNICQTNAYITLTHNKESDILKFVNTLGFLISILIPVITITNTILNFIKEDDTKYKILSNGKLISKSIGITIAWFVINLFSILIISLFLNVFFKLDIFYSTLKIYGVIFFITVIPFLIKNVKERRYLIRIMENYKYKDKIIKQHSNSIEDIFSTIAKNDINNELGNEQSYVDKFISDDIEKNKEKINQAKVLNREIKRVNNLNKSYNNLRLCTWFFYPTLIILGTYFGDKLGNRNSSTSFMILIFVLLSLFNIMMVYKDLTIINGTATIPIDILEEHIYNYDEKLNKKDKDQTN